MAKFTVKKIRKAPYAGYWGVYRGRALLMAFKQKSAATTDCDRRNDDEDRKNK